MIVEQQKFRIRNTNSKSAKACYQGYVIFSKDVTKKLEEKEQEVVCLLFTEEELDKGINVDDVMKKLKDYAEFREKYREVMELKGKMLK